MKAQPTSKQLKARVRNLRWKRSNPDKVKQDHHNRRLAKYNLTREEFDSMLSAQGGNCRLCGNPPDRYQLAIDHCHNSRLVRGLLCRGCNAGIGLLGDTADSVSSAVQYLRDFENNVTWNEVLS